MATVQPRAFATIKESRMIRPITIRAALLAATAVVVGAPALAIAAPALSAPTAVVITPANDGSTVTLKKRDTLTISLADNNPSTGFAWAFTPRPNPTILKLVSDKTTPPAPTDPPTAGAPEPRTIIYTAATTGRTKFRLLHVSPAGQPEATLRVTVDVRGTTPCSVKGLRAVKKQGSATFSVAVRTLLQTAGNCSRARQIAKLAARTILADRALPDRILGFKITARAPCGGCTPITAVTATHGTARVTFNLAGGA
jgi:predicted secreted protein